MRRSSRASPVALLVALTLSLAVVASLPAIAQQGEGDRSGLGPVKEFSEQLKILKDRFNGLRKSIDESTKTIDGLTDPRKARAEIEALQASVSGLLEAVVDNGEVAGLGEKALKHAREKLAELERDTRFSPEKRQGLVDAWRRFRQETEQAVQELTSARTRLVGLLRQLQSEQDYIGELLQIEQFDKALATIRQLTRDIQGVSGELERLINGLKPPGV